MGVVKFLFLFLQQHRNALKVSTPPPPQLSGFPCIFLLLTTVHDGVLEELRDGNPHVGDFVSGQLKQCGQTLAGKQLTRDVLVAEKRVTLLHKPDVQQQGQLHDDDYDNIIITIMSAILPSIKK